MKRRALIALIFACLASGCHTAPASRSYADRLIDHAQFKAAAKAAPIFTQAVLDVVAELESELRKR